MVPSLRAVLISLVPAIVLLATAAVAQHPLSLLVVMAEPLLLAAGAYGLVLATWNRRPLWAGAIAASLVAGGFSLHEAELSAPPLRQGPEWMRQLRGCTLLAKPTTGPVRLVSWTVDEGEGLSEGVDSILDIRPDIVILSGTRDRELGAKIQQALNGEVKFIPDGDGMLAAVRGSFQYCGGENDEWHLDLPAKAGGSAGVMVGFPHVTDVGVVPLMVARMDQPQGVLDWPAWSQRVVDGATQSSAAAQTIGSRKMVLMTSLGAPSTALALSSPLTSAGLASAGIGPNWPAELAGFPFWTQHNVDQIWTGSGWHVQSSKVLAVQGQVRGPVALDLVPNLSP